jgi:hypothetical protein
MMVSFASFSGWKNFKMRAGCDQSINQPQVLTLIPFPTEVRRELVADHR